MDKTFDITINKKYYLKNGISSLTLIVILLVIALISFLLRDKTAMKVHSECQIYSPYIAFTIYN